MSQPCRWNSMNVAFTPYGRVLVMPAGQVALQRTTHRTRPVTSDIKHSLRANDRRREGSPGHVQLRSSQLDALSGNAERRPETVRTHLTSGKAGGSKPICAHQVWQLCGLLM